MIYALGLSLLSISKSSYLLFPLLVSAILLSAYVYFSIRHSMAVWMSSLLVIILVIATLQPCITTDKCLIDNQYLLIVFQIATFLLLALCRRKNMTNQTLINSFRSIGSVFIRLTCILIILLNLFSIWRIPFVLSLLDTSSFREFGVYDVSFFAPPVSKSLIFSLPFLRLSSRHVVIDELLLLGALLLTKTRTEAFMLTFILIADSIRYNKIMPMFFSRFFSRLVISRKALLIVILSLLSVVLMVMAFQSLNDTNSFLNLSYGQFLDLNDSGLLLTGSLAQRIAKIDSFCGNFVSGYWLDGTLIPHGVPSLEIFFLRLPCRYGILLTFSWLLSVLLFLMIYIRYSKNFALTILILIFTCAVNFYIVSYFATIFISVGAICVLACGSKDSSINKIH